MNQHHFASRAFVVSLPITLMVLLVGFAAHADFAGQDQDVLVDQVSLAQQNCRENEPCSMDGLDVLTLFDHTSQISTPDVQPLLPRLQLIAEDQASIWGDTILEGEFTAENATSLDQVQSLSRDGQIVAYRITYSENAWKNTDVDHREPGKIRESSFVSAGLASWFRDMTALANFEKSSAVR